MAASCRSLSWSDKEVKGLIWGDEKVQEELDGAVRNKSAFKKISRNIIEMGIMRDWKQCSDKVKNLTVAYKHSKTTMEI